MEEIVNKVAASQPSVFDLEDYYPDGSRVGIDISQWLEDGLVLREKKFREQLLLHDWQQYADSYAALYCATDAIVPTWAFILVSISLAPHARKIISGRVEDIDSILYEEILARLDFESYRQKPVIIKGCAYKLVPISAYVLAAQYLTPVAKSIMYGEACSAVPLYKKRLV